MQPDEAVVGASVTSAAAAAAAAPAESLAKHLSKLIVGLRIVCKRRRCAEMKPKTEYVKVNRTGRRPCRTATRRLNNEVSARIILRFPMAIARRTKRAARHAFWPALTRQEATPARCPLSNLALAQ